MKKRNDVRFIAMVSTGAALVLTVSLLEGIEKAAANAFYHVVKDVTSELQVHAYIAGTILFAFGLYRYARRHWMIGTLRCPKCYHKQKMEIPKEKCVHFYKCESCKKFIQGKGKCVFCSYSDKKCPSGCL